MSRDEEGVIEVVAVDIGDDEDDGVATGSGFVGGELVGVIHCLVTGGHWMR